MKHIKKINELFGFGNSDKSLLKKLVRNFLTSNKISCLEEDLNFIEKTYEKLSQLLKDNGYDNKIKYGSAYGWLDRNGEEMEEEEYEVPPRQIDDKHTWIEIYHKNVKGYDIIDIFPVGGKLEGIGNITIFYDKKRCRNIYFSEKPIWKKEEYIETKTKHRIKKIS